MLYFNELPRPPRQLLSQHRHFSIRAHKSGNDVLLRKRKQHRKLWPYIRKYCDNSSIHGIRYLTDNKLQRFEKLIWLLLLLATTICLIYVYVDLADLYNSERIMQTVDNSMYPVFQIPFPSVGVCPATRINWPKLENMAPEHFLGANATNEQKYIFREFFGALKDVQLKKLTPIEHIVKNESLARLLPLLNHLDITEVMRYLMLTCVDIFTDYCYWRGSKYNCCDIFILERTESGFCYVFNSAISPELQERKRHDKFYPWHNPSFGESTGLDFIMKFNKSQVNPSITGEMGAYVMLKQPEQWHDDVKPVPANAYTKIVVSPRYSSTDRRTRAVSPEMRRCLFDDEDTHPLYKKIPGLIYWRGNCRTRCHQEYVFAYCNCTPSLLFPLSEADDFRDCQATDYKCLYNNRHIFTNEHHKAEKEYLDDANYNQSMICDCPNSCTQLIYDKVQSSTPNEEDSKLYKSVHLDIFFHSQFMLKYSTRMRFTFVELIASFGGIMGLFLGASLLSAIELIYYFTIGFYLYLYPNWQPKREKTAELPIIKMTHKVMPQKPLY